MKRIYLDYAATTPVDSAVFAAMRPYFGIRFGNAGSVHSFGQEAIAALDLSRERIAHLLGAMFREIVFTGSATEANNLALRGTVRAARDAGIVLPKVVVSAIEHESVLATARDLAREGAELAVIPVSREGIVDLKKLQAALDERTALVSVMYASNEIGAIQPVAEIGRIVAARRHGLFPRFHVDAVQAFPYLPVRPAELGADLVTLSAHKVYGPKGVGVLYARRELGAQRSPGALTVTSANALRPVITGGGQEFGLRSGTENVACVVGAAEAFVRADRARAVEARRIGNLRDFFWKGLAAGWRGAAINGGMRSRLPNNLNVWFPGRRAEELLVFLDRNGIAASAGAACASRALEPSYVIQALGFSKERARGSVRFTLGRQTTILELARTIKGIQEFKRSGK